MNHYLEGHVRAVHGQLPTSAALLEGVSNARLLFAGVVDNITAAGVHDLTVLVVLIAAPALSPGVGILQEGTKNDVRREPRKL